MKWSSTFAIGSCRRVMKLVDHDVVESVGCEAIEVSRQRLHRGEHDVRIGLLFVAVVQAYGCIGYYLSENVAALLEDLFPMRDEQHAI